MSSTFYRYRFRLVNLACDPNYTFSIDGHTFTIIEADGVATQPLVVDSLDIFAAQRYSLIVRVGCGFEAFQLAHMSIR